MELSNFQVAERCRTPATHNAGCTPTCHMDCLSQHMTPSNTVDTLLPLHRRSVCRSHCTMPVPPALHAVAHGSLLLCHAVGPLLYHARILCCALPPKAGSGSGNWRRGGEPGHSGTNSYWRSVDRGEERGGSAQAGSLGGHILSPWEPHAAHRPPVGSNLSLGFAKCHSCQWAQISMNTFQPKREVYMKLATSTALWLL